MTDITELAQSLKAAAVRVIKNYDSEWFEAGHQICTVHKSKINLISLANPVNVLALVEALEKVQAQSSKWLEAYHKAVSIGARYEERIAELEGCEIKPAKGEVLVTVTGYTGCGKSAIAGEIEIAMKAIGVPVQWTNGDAEKRTTGADWLTAIEMYKPSVRIVEVNLPRAAGISLKIEGE
ncbi:ead/Ea22-like family protein [Klebsiella oxytoca]|nr:ead/Ea22-like family protein [Klebsiella oxytoca]DAU92334.1 MAG TPA: Ead/Ea22-like protein [Bacteriophage sp.]MBL5997465.1 ead/Ea22-like family protein [Klebsiella oxytoca]MBL6213326.1 ead/Ea22-like family protein [Klebsiella oxytoca]UHC78634.1 ead/Ea22-like family protein [Klebsiella oxytoca]UHC95712.1 ead/Ea22-like family protein [Klebsiella oxytoca]